MDRKVKYSTKQKKLVFNSIKELRQSFNAKDIYNIINLNEEVVGLTTIYRYLEDLEKDNIIKKAFDNKYIYLEKCTCKNHFYLKCKECKKTFHLDCDCILEIKSHVSEKHNFILDDNSILLGVCENCKNKERRI